MQKRPGTNEYNPYYSTYIKLVPDGDIIHILEQQMKETNLLLKDISDSEGHFRYAPNKWSIKEVIGHIADTERIMAYRLVSIARGETAELPGYNDDMYVLRAAFDKQSMQDLLTNLTVVRQSTVHLLKSLDTDAWLQRGIANNSEVTVRALANIIAGHELHHRQIIKVRYFGANAFTEC
ncbi:damage-inducible protein DinB [Bacillus toyonensis]|uniref:Damage-inducible protein DinB n=1 Tax=Bacillus toyonensis TaxID=155322 RepID=A0AB73QU82_9BACI|nr:MULTISPECIES: DinB family protein [Bacillus cereus group]MBJ7929285.1 DinB family protein [Bacillus cereus group sp. N31]PEG15590.1 damage-inducible protein DinB [Bacillus toyonensis]PEI83314.1 damage-inducible protein DinB [Bacillus toyonensis]PEL43982.1 damage-inducible protein DinB [Bacillus toyonensis]PEM15570.1 damage-inducible protein DinB [Bacillus toyonensis]